uniref:Uncharacterized protein n=1 Tax=Chromera velia CCMP2878 TaxID=1169474 RepID=A0A0G4HSJ9_9ALVE|eukprot:Cvel_31109.t1-p1 / transcript=Cvel_31109.t1 / gene=Cvel_31109 / organism=Chromera_velia_CCMP2878 / gene_product=hypothetical protein / transcript_product=hypothetical protein / location=Cvel_scaffold4568:387-1517(+) / protein_length=255 / sequence_SO=supercontig / SO=protein_coding / is_pseudo=false
MPSKSEEAKARKKERDAIYQKNRRASKTEARKAKLEELNVPKPKRGAPKGKRPEKVPGGLKVDLVKECKKRFREREEFLLGSSEEELSSGSGRIEELFPSNSSSSSSSSATASTVHTPPSLISPPTAAAAAAADEPQGPFPLQRHAAALFRGQAVAPTEAPSLCTSNNLFIEREGPPTPLMSCSSSDSEADDEGLGGGGDENMDGGGRGGVGGCSDEEGEDEDEDINGGGGGGGGSDGEGEDKDEDAPPLPEEGI